MQFIFNFYQRTMWRKFSYTRVKSALWNIHQKFSRFFTLTNIFNFHTILRKFSNVTDESERWEKSLWYHVSWNYNDGIVLCFVSCSEIEWKDMSAQFHFINNDNARQFRNSRISFMPTPFHIILNPLLIHHHISRFLRCKHNLRSIKWRRIFYFVTEISVFLSYSFNDEQRNRQDS